MMQQTENYKLNLIETSDPFSPAPLNENAQKTEAALAAEAAARQALDGRVQVLELRRIVVGSYAGSGIQTDQFIGLDFTPAVVFSGMAGDVNVFSMAIPDSPNSEAGKIQLRVEENGFRVFNAQNSQNLKYHYVALL